MIRSKLSRNVVAAGLSVLFAATTILAQTGGTLSGRELLRAIRQRQGQAQKPAYENRIAEPVIPEEPAAHEEPAVPKEPAAPEEPAAPKEPPAAEKPTQPTVSDIGAKPVPESPGDELLRMVPAQSLFCLRVNNFDYTLSQIDQFLAGISPMPMGVSMLVRMQLANILGSPELTGVNMGGDFAIFGPLVNTDMSDLDNIGILIPVTDYKQFISGNPNVSQPDEKGISKITSDGMHPLLVTQAAGYALITPQGNDSELTATAKSISARAAGLPSTLDAAQAKQAIEQPIWAYANVQQASTTFGPLVLGKIEETKTMMEEMKAAGQAPMGDSAAAIQMCAGILDVLMKQTKSLSIAVNPKPSVLNIAETISAVPGTEMADMFTADPSTKQENKLLGYLEDGAMINASGKVTGKLNAKAMDFFATVISKNMSPEDKAKIKSLASDIATVFSGNDAMSFSIDPKNKPLFAGKYVTEIKDKDKVNKLIEEGTALFNTGCVADFYESLGLKPTFTLKRAADSYKGVSIDSAKLIMAPTDANSPQAQMIVAMYGDGFNYRWGAVDGLWVCAYGGKVDSPIRELIDLVKAGGPKQMAAEIKTALALVPDADKADFFVTYNYVRALEMLPAMMGAMMPVPMPEIDIPTKSNIVLAGQIGGGKITIDIAIPKEHLTEIVAAFTMMMQQQMMQQMPTPGQPTMQQNVWTCSMHPQVRTPQKGKCPMCGMNLVPAPPVSVQSNVDKARVTTTKASLRILHSAVNKFKTDTGRFPTEEQGLQALVEKPRRVTNYPLGGYLDTTEVPKDAWGNDFVYQPYTESGKPFVIISYGADGQRGGTGYNKDLYTTDAF